MLSPGFPSITFVFHTIAIKRSVGGTNIKKKKKKSKRKIHGDGRLHGPLHSSHSCNAVTVEVS